MPIQMKINKDLIISDSNTTLDNLSGLHGKLLWFNNNPGETFDEQDIILSDTDYDTLEVYYYDYRQIQYMKSVKVIRGHNIKLDALFHQVGGAPSYLAERELTYISAGKYHAELCYSADSAAGYRVVTTGAQCIPYAIIGYKYKIDNLS